MHTNNKIKLLSDTEINDIYAFPLFNEVEQSLYFEFTEQELEVIRKYRTIKARVSFMLSLGYFKAKQQFYLVNLSISQDIQYVIKKYFNESSSKLSDKINYKTYQKQKADILILLNYQDWSQELESKISLWVCKLLRYHPKPHSAARQLLDYLDKQQIIVPGYRKLQDIFTNAFAHEEKRLSGLVSKIPEYITKQLSTIIKRDDGISGV